VATGDLAPDFELPGVDDRSTVRLSSLLDERPVALVFGSYT
jgi:peroxiredoxin